jgi:hypothetical protein
MKKNLTLCIAALLAVACGSLPAEAAIVRPTNFGVGADANPRDDVVAPSGASTELGLRIRNDFALGDPADSGDRHGVMYLKFDLSGLTVADAVSTAVRVTARNNNQITSGRAYDTDGVNPDYGRNGLRYYGIPGATFDESSLIYFTAPGLTYDGNRGTKDWNASAQLLGEVDFDLGTSNGYYVGQPVILSGSPVLDAFIAGEIATNPNGVAVIAVELQNNGLADEPATWKNFNYLFNPKEMLTLNTNATWDADINNPNNPLGGPHSGASNADGAFSPTLILGYVPEPNSFVLLGLAALSTLLNRRRS